MRHEIAFHGKRAKMALGRVSSYIANPPRAQTVHCKHFVSGPSVNCIANVENYIFAIHAIEYINLMAMFFLPIITVALNFVFTILAKGVEDQKGRQLIVNRVFRESFTLRFK